MNRWLACLALAWALGCDERGGGGTVVPEGGGGDSELRPEGDHEGETMAELEVRLDKLVARQTHMVAAGTDDPHQCEPLCELSRAICEIKTKMCSIAEERVTDPEYQNLCRKAKQRCSDASESCIQCVGRSGEAGEGTCEGEPSAK
ncbi:hypothetical protein ACNOYE_03375 [Nannocystaceae bacterium ST9]